MRVLGVVLSANLTMGIHVDEILSSSVSSVALRMVRSHGLGSPQLHVIARSATLASMLYASPAWWGFTSARDKDRLEKLMVGCRGEVFSRMMFCLSLTWLQMLIGGYLGLSSPARVMC